VTEIDSSLQNFFLLFSDKKVQWLQNAIYLIDLCLWVTEWVLNVG